MNHGSLFSGIGGFDLAARWMGWDNLFHVEWNPWCRQVLEYHFPESKSYTDVKQFDGTAWRGKVDIISGGFPCQPYSSAGKRMGKDDERHLWPEMLRIIREAAPAYVVGENVRGLTNWNGGVVFEEVCADLEAAGYEVWTGIVPAAGVGAPHRRDRVWFVAHAHDHGAVRTPRRNAGACNSEGISERDEVRITDQSGDVRDASDTDSAGCAEAAQRGGQKREPNYRNEVRSEFDATGNVGDAANTDSCRSGKVREDLEPKKSNGEGSFCDGGERDATDPERVRLEHVTERIGVGKGKGKTRQRAKHVEANGNSQDAANPYSKRLQRSEEDGDVGQSRAQRDQLPRGCVLPKWENFPTQPPVCGGNDGLSRELDGITFSKWRNESIKAYGNAIVPQVAYQIFQAIASTHEQY